MAKQIVIEKSKIGDDPSTYRFTFDEDGIQKAALLFFLIVHIMFIEMSANISQ